MHLKVRQVYTCLVASIKFLVFLKMAGASTSLTSSESYASSCLYLTRSHEPICPNLGIDLDKTLHQHVVESKAFG